MKKNGAGIFAFMLLFPALCNAWYLQQHRIICEAAWQRLTAEARSMVLSLHRRANQRARFNRFSDSCGWPDTVRKSTHVSTDEYHYANVEFNAKHFELERDCPARDCVVIGIKRYGSYLIEQPQTSREKDKQAEALRFFAHFVADIHQPLHVSYKEDLGGNGIKVIWLNNNSHNLHAIWDSLIPSFAGYDAVADAGKLLQSATIKPSWLNTNISAWADESYQLAKNYAYRYEDGSLLRDNDKLPLSYVERAAPIVTVQMQKAAGRLAYLLNEIAAKNLTPNDLLLIVRY